MCHKRGRGPKPRDLLPRRGKRCVQFPQSKSGPRYLTDGEIGISVEQTGREPRPHVWAGKVRFCLFRRFLRPPAKIVVFRHSDVLLGAGGHILHCLPAIARRKGCVHQGHKICVIQKPIWSCLCRNRPGLPPCPARVLWFRGIGGNGPGFPEFPCAGNPSFRTILEDPPLRYFPFFCCLSYR